MENTSDGVKVGGMLVQAVRFADDQAMVSSTNAGLQRMMDVLNATSKEYGMKINIKKTKVMRISRTERAKAKILIDGNSLEQVMEYCYLGSTVTSDGKCHKDIRKRIAMGKSAFNKRSELLRGKLSLQLKKRMVKSLIWSVTLYASETWTLRKEDIKRLEAFEMWIWRRIERINWMEHWKNVDVLLLVNEERSLNDTIRQRQKNWIGHILRYTSFTGCQLQRESSSNSAYWSTIRSTAEHRHIWPSWSLPWPTSQVALLSVQQEGMIWSFRDQDWFRPSGRFPLRHQELGTVCPSTLDWLLTPNCSKKNWKHIFSIWLILHYPNDCLRINFVRILTWTMLSLATGHCCKWH